MPWHLNLTLALCFANGASVAINRAKFNAARLLRRALKFYAANLAPNREAQILK